MSSSSIKEFTIEELKRSLDKGGNINVPKYQRGISWKKSQQDKLIDSLINKYPFGCLLLYEIDTNNYKIIDGLQRSYTVIDFYDKPMTYFSERHISESEIEKIVKYTDDLEIKEDIRINLPHIIQEYVSSTCMNIEQLKEIDTASLAAKVIEKWGSLIRYTDNIIVILKNITNNFCNYYDDISENLRIPALVFKSPEEKLPEIFERINTEGSKLSKYQIYSATWSDDKVVINNKNLQDIITYVKNRYDSYLREIGTLEDYDSRKITMTKEISIFDMIYGFGKMICKEFNNLFIYEPDTKDGNIKVDSIGFNLINSCLLQKSSNMKNLNIIIKELVGYESNDICTFLNNILECIKHVNKKLRRGIDFKCNKKQDSNISPLHTELQIVSIIASLFIEKYVSYENDDEGNIKNIVVHKVCKPEWNEYKKSKFDSNVLKIYAKDLIEAKWKGSGDSKLYNILTNKKYYMRSVTWEEFEECLNHYYEGQKSERNEKTKVSNPSSADKLILNLVYMNILSAGDQLDDTSYDIEHLATKGNMKSKIKYYNEKEKEDFSLPISSIGNLCLLPKEYNEQKGEKLIYQFQEYFDKKTKQNVKIPISKYEKKFTFTTSTDFDWLTTSFKDCTSQEFKKNYDQFLNKRFKNIKKKIKQNLFPE